MTIHQKYARYLLVTVTLTLMAAYGIAATSVEGIGLAILFAAAGIFGYLTVGLFVAILTKNPTKTLHGFFKILDPFLWP
jgi:hypothetical protein